MLARIFNSVLLPEPLRPTMPKNSPLRTSKEITSRAFSSRKSRPAKGRTRRSLNESTRWVGMRKALRRSSTWIASGSPTAGARRRRSTGEGRGGALSTGMAAWSLASLPPRGGVGGARDGRAGQLQREARRRNIQDRIGGAAFAAAALGLVDGGFPGRGAAELDVAFGQGDEHRDQQRRDDGKARPAGPLAPAPPFPASIDDCHDHAYQQHRR